MHVRNPLLVHYLLWLALVGEIINLPLGLQLAYDRAHLQDRRTLLSQECFLDELGRYADVKLKSLYMMSTTVYGSSRASVRLCIVLSLTTS